MRRPPTGRLHSSTAIAHIEAHDNLRAIDRLKFAADNFPALGDYALYYLALAEHDQGDLKASADTLERLVSLYPDSVLIDPRRDDAGGQPAEAGAQPGGIRCRCASHRARARNLRSNRRRASLKGVR